MSNFADGLAPSFFPGGGLPFIHTCTRLTGPSNPDCTISTARR